MGGLILSDDKLNNYTKLGYKKGIGQVYDLQKILTPDATSLEDYIQVQKVIPVSISSFTSIANNFKKSVTNHPYSGEKYSTPPALFVRVSNFAGGTVTDPMTGNILESYDTVLPVSFGNDSGIEYITYRSFSDRCEITVYTQFEYPRGLDMKIYVLRRSKSSAKLTRDANPE